MSACPVCGKWMDRLFTVLTSETLTEVPMLCSRECALKAPIDCDCGEVVDPKDWPEHYDNCPRCEK